jgi:hypothetical protein
MREQRTIYCEGPECDTHISTARPHGTYPMGWVTTSWWEDGKADPVEAFCSWDCVMKRAAKHPPVVTIPWDDVEGAE